MFNFQKFLLHYHYHQSFWWGINFINYLFLNPVCPTLLLLRLFEFSCIEVHFMSKKVAADQCLLCHFLVKFYLWKKNLTHQMSMLPNSFNTNSFKRHECFICKVFLKEKKAFYLIPGEIWTSQQPQQWSILGYKCAILKILWLSKW